MTTLKMEDSTFTLQLDRFLSIWNNAVHCMKFWVCAVAHTEQQQFLAESTKLPSTITISAKGLICVMKLFKQRLC